MTMRANNQPKPWPLPSVTMQLAFCALTFAAASTFGRVGAAAIFLLVVLLPTARLEALFRQGDYSGVIAVYLGTMIVANIEGLALLFELPPTYGSGPLVLGIAVCALARLSKIRNEYVPALLLLASLFLMQVMTAGDWLLDTALRQTSYLLALMLLLTLLPSKAIREAWVEKLALLAAYFLGHFTCEMIFPASGLSISVTQHKGITGRAAGLYSNANMAGVIVALIPLLACFSCQTAPLNSFDKYRLVSLHVLCLISIGMTSSRQAALLFAMPLLIMTSKVSGKLRAFSPLAIVVGIAILFLNFELLSQTEFGLSQDVQTRYTSLKRVLTFGILGNDGEATVEYDRIDNLRDTAKYWSNPTVFGRGHDFIKKLGLDDELIVHNQLLMHLIETGYLGVTLFLLAIAACIGTRWAGSRENTLKCAIMTFELAVLIISTHNLFDFRCFALPIAMLMWISWCPVSAYP